jgi:hypothetical protein
MSLTYRDRGTSGTQLDVVSGEVRIATLWKNKFSVGAGGGEEWRWTFTLSAGPPGFAVHGEADSKIEAQAKLELIWERWVAAAGLSETTR